ncbi:sensor histidine kinase [Streptomyces europaeiscabiei]|uniref:sensor histidine kinase n=1 Tax=Streptomyces europaeiscabiei TaxID=146819 RepID=UPI0029BAE070|nr:HAMP domain-containing sensor histidine kinase [Streptomyces europaeiscabiei]MDX2525723.1 HAMP domain-containing sensor histidine kinase [Streptomyces europaeiscabiei]MDX3776997.1 HAMP domain-containing sensor histidine kinase [Streptomyces europaeiscabiei]
MKWGPPRRLASLTARLGLRRGTARARFTALYVTLFLLSGTALLAIAAVGGSLSSPAAPDGGTIWPNRASSAQARIDELEQQLAQAHDNQTKEILIGSAIALGVMTVVSVGLGWFLAGRVLRPLRVMTAATRRITADSLHERLAIDGPVDEVKDLADTIDDLLGRLERSFEAQRLFVANASHELRTPLTTMRASLDVALAKPGPVPETTATLAARLRTELDQVDLLLESFLVLARAQHGEFTDSGRLALGRLTRDALARRAGDIGAKGLAVRETRIDGSAWVWGSRTLLRRAADNVIDNAIAHNDSGGWIGAAVRAEEGEGDGGRIVSLVVESSGPVLDQQRVADLAQPFRRLGADRTSTGRGSGLGLSIVAAIVAAHHGTLDLHARPDGGLRVTVTLPRTDDRTAKAPNAERDVAR